MVCIDWTTTQLCTWMYTRLKKLAILLLNFTACKPTKELCSFFIALLTFDILNCCITCKPCLFLSLICLLSYLKLVPPELYRALFNDLQDFRGGQVTSLAVLLNTGREERENLQTTRSNIVIPVHKFDVNIHWRNCLITSTNFSCFTLYLITGCFNGYKFGILKRYIYILIILMNLLMKFLNCFNIHKFNCDNFNFDINHKAKAKWVNFYAQA